MNIENKASADESLQPEIPDIAIIAASLRRIRKMRGLTLKEVEVKSRGQWKAVVIGSYERCDRALSLNKAIALAHFYNVPLEDLLGISRNVKENLSRLTFDMRAIDSLNDPDIADLKRFLSRIVSQRRDWNGEVLSIRSSDFLAIFAMLDISEDQLLPSLKKAQLTFSRVD